MMAVGAQEQLEQRISTGALAAITILAIAACAGWYWLAICAREFVWDDDFAKRPILNVMLLLAVQWLIWGGIVWIASHLSESKQKRAAFVCCLAGLVSQLFFLNANPILEHDGYRYLWDGSTLAAGVSPYRYAPVAIRNALPDDSDAVKLAQAFRARSDWEASSTLDKIGYPEIKTIYPPAAQFTFLAAFKIGDWSWSGLRIVFVAAYFCGVLLTSGAMRSARVAMMLALCPLAIKEIGNSAHLDAMLVLYFGAILFVLSKAERIAPLWISVAVGGLMALTIATKLYPIIAMPILASWFAARFSWKFSGLFVVSTASFVGLLYAPFLAMGERNFFSALTPFGNTWQRNESVFGLLQFGATFLLGESTVAMASIPGASGPLGTVAAKLTAHLLLLTACGTCARYAFIKARAENPVVLISQCTGLLFIVWFLLLPMAFPWYLLGALPFFVGASSKWGAMPWALVACAGVFYYGEFYVDTLGLPGRALNYLHAIEYGLALAMALGLWILHRCRRSSMEHSVG